VIDWQPDHLSCYSLIVEEGTPLALQVADKRVKEPDPDLVATLAEHTEDRLAARDYQQYEISNYTRQSGRECRHNLVYWRHGEYVGVGPGAHGFVDGIRYSVERSPLRYARLLQETGGRNDVPTPAAVSSEKITPEIAALDTFIMGMRLNAGIDTKTFARDYPDAWSGFQEALAWGQGEGLTATESARLMLTAKGRRLANELFVRIMEPSLL
jgi:oxygen-independent coproporphyrinogen-3 oxidase